VNGRRFVLAARGVTVLLLDVGVTAAQLPRSHNADGERAVNRRLFMLFALFRSTLMPR
jgi:hypothetical protein